MTSMQRIDWTLLNAYVDGELDASTAADIAAAIARDPELAARVAALARLKAATGALAAAPTLSLPTAPRRRRAATVGGMAAGIAALFLVAAGIAWSLLERSDEPLWLRPVAAAHEQWLAAPASLARAGGVSDDNLLREARVVGIGQVPDLTDAQLRPAWVSITGGDGLYVGYIGVHGCRLGLWVGSSTGDVPRGLAPVVLPQLTAYAWHAAGRSYVVVARGMDAGRFSLLARTIERLTRQGAHPDEQTRTALREAPLTGSACAT